MSENSAVCASMPVDTAVKHQTSTFIAVTEIMTKHWDTLTGSIHSTTGSTVLLNNNATVHCQFGAESRAFVTGISTQGSSPIDSFKVFGSRPNVRCHVRFQQTWMHRIDTNLTASKHTRQIKQTTRIAG